MKYNDFKEQYINSVIDNLKNMFETFEKYKDFNVVDEELECRLCPFGDNCTCENPFTTCAEQLERFIEFD